MFTTKKYSYIWHYVMVVLTPALNQYGCIQIFGIKYNLSYNFNQKTLVFRLVVR